MGYLRYLISLGTWLLISGALVGCVQPAATLDHDRIAYRKHLVASGKKSFLQGDYHQAASYLQPAAACGEPEAEYALGYLYYNGWGVAKDKLRGAALIRQAADHGNREAIRALEVIQIDQGPLNADKSHFQSYQRQYLNHHYPRQFYRHGHRSDFIDTHRIHQDVSSDRSISDLIDRRQAQNKSKKPSKPTDKHRNGISVTAIRKNNWLDQ